MESAIREDGAIRTKAYSLWQCGLPNRANSPRAVCGRTHPYSTVRKYLFSLFSCGSVDPFERAY